MPGMSSMQGTFVLKVNISHRFKHLYDAIETGKINLGDMAPRIHGLRKRQEKLQARRAQT